MVYEVTDGNFDEMVVRSDVPCVMEFTASWCALCPQMEPVMEALSERFAGRVRFCTVDTDAERKLRIAFAVAALPYIVFVRDGMKTPLFDQIVGEERLAERIQHMLDGKDAPGTVPLRPLR